MDNSINMHVSMPCPLKVPFRQLVTPFVESYNATQTDHPVYCPNSSDCSSEDIELMLQTAKDENDLPDIIVTTNYRIILSHGFYNRFIRNHIYEGLTEKTSFEKLPQPIRDNLQ